MKRGILLLVILLIGCVVIGVGESHAYSSRDLIDTWMLYGEDTVGRPLERGGATVTTMPGSNAVKLSAYGTDTIASVRYKVRIPRDARSIRIKVAYHDTSSLTHSDEVAGRAWVKREKKGEDYALYYPDDPDKSYAPIDSAPLFGDIYVLYQGKGREVIELSADDHVLDGYLELHIFAVGAQQIDVEQIEVEAYTSAYRSKVVTRYVKDYQWRPWRYYGYWSFYTGPTYWYNGRWYVRYHYPGYTYHRRRIHRHWNGYWNGYYTRYPHSRNAWRRYHHNTYHPPVKVDKYTHNVWTKSHTETRQRYVRARVSNNTAALQEVNNGLMQRRAANLSVSPNVRTRERPGVSPSATENRVPGTATVRDTETRSRNGTTWGPSRQRDDRAAPAVWSNGRTEQNPDSPRRDETPGITGTRTRNRPGNGPTRDVSPGTQARSGEQVKPDSQTRNPGPGRSRSSGGSSKETVSSSGKRTYTPPGSSSSVRNRGGGSKTRTPAKSVSKAPPKEEEKTDKGGGQRPASRARNRPDTTRSAKTKK